MSATALKDDSRIAVLGGGVAGLCSAWLISRRHQVTLFNDEARLGGHTHTVELLEGPDRGLGIDTGFIVCNDRNYPLFHKFLAELGVKTRDADMSFGYEDAASGLAYSAASLSGIFAQRKNLLSPAYWGLWKQILRFQRLGLSALKDASADGLSLGDFLTARQVRPDAIDHYIVPMGAAIWSASRRDILNFPASAYLQFFKNHGLLSVTDMPQWQTVIGGSHAYVQAFCRQFKGSVELGRAVKSVRRGDQDVTLALEDGTQHSFDAIVIATHADQAKDLLSDPSPDEARLLGAWRYQANTVVLHSDASLVPSLARARASWNYQRRLSSGDDDPVTVTYDMTRLMGLQASQEYFVTLNSSQAIDPAKVIKTIDYEHPHYSASSVATQAHLPMLNGKKRTWFCGSYFGHGFHEDAVKSAVAVARDFGEGL